MNFKNTRLQGDAGVAAALAYFTSQGWPVSLPFGEGQRYDLIVDDGALKRVQCKTAFQQNKQGNYRCELRTSGGNRSGRGKVSYISSGDVELVSVLDGAGGLWLFPIADLDARSVVALTPSKRHRKVL